MDEQVCRRQNGRASHPYQASTRIGYPVGHGMPCPYTTKCSVIFRIGCRGHNHSRMDACLASADTINRTTRLDAPNTNQSGIPSLSGTSTAPGTPRMGTACRALARGSPPRSIQMTQHWTFAACIGIVTVSDERHSANLTNRCSAM